MKESTSDTINGKDWQRGKIREWEMAVLPRVRRE